jgi:nickel-dependent lactate racemase
MKTVLLRYGREGLEIQVPENADVYQAAWKNAFMDEETAIRKVLMQPIGTPALRELLRPSMRVVIVHTDLTRATPNALLILPILSEILIAGIPSNQVTLINALGSHRKQTDNEMVALLGEKITAYYRCIQHDAFDRQANLQVGKTATGQPVRINREFVEADFRILTGFIEPHFFAGYSGGPKLVLPGLADLETIQWNHRPESIASEKATWCLTSGNPIWEEMHAVAKRFDPLFNVNVTLDGANKINGIFCGDLFASHTAGCQWVEQQCLFHVPALYDLVITTNSGYPLDQNLYQTVKGMSAAARITRPGGQILMAAACEDGIPNHGAYAQILAGADSPEALLESILHGHENIQDQWQVQKQAQIQMQYDVSIFSQGLTDDEITRAHYRPVRSIKEEIARVLSENPLARIAVLPEGPQTIGKRV